MFSFVLMIHFCSLAAKPEYVAVKPEFVAVKLEFVAVNGNHGILHYPLTRI